MKLLVIKRRQKKKVAKIGKMMYNATKSDISKSVTKCVNLGR